MSQALLFDYWRSSASYRVRIALNLKHVGYERAPIDLIAGDQKSDAYRERNPQGFVPLLEIDGRSISQSLAIIDYLDATRPDPPLVPSDPGDRAHVLALALTVACDIHPLNNLLTPVLIFDQFEELFTHGGFEAEQEIGRAHV